MTDQLPLFPAVVRSTHPKELARRDGPETSKMAAERIVFIGKHATDEAAAYKLVAAHPGRTGYELDRIGNAQKREISRRLGGLERKGFVWSGKERRCAVAGSKCKTWWPVGGGK